MLCVVCLVRIVWFVGVRFLGSFSIASWLVCYTHVHVHRKHRSYSYMRDCVLIFRGQVYTNIVRQKKVLFI